MKLGDFKFQLTAEELAALRSQFATSNDKDGNAKAKTTGKKA